MAKAEKIEEATKVDPKEKEAAANDAKAKEAATKITTPSKAKALPVAKRAPVKAAKKVATKE